VSIQAHDALFKSAFEHPSHAAGLFRHVLPPALAGAIDWTTLELQSGSFVDPTLRSRHSDLLFSARVDDRMVLLYVLLEHQSSNDPSMPLRSLDYAVCIWRRHEQQFVAHVCENLHYEQFREQLRDQLPQTEKPLMTMAEELIQQGRIEGRATGRAEGQAALLSKQLTRKYGEIPPLYRARIEAATSEQLEAYAERFVFADTLASVFADD
jgi:predicted transposase YdaD